MAREKPDIQDAKVVECLYDQYGLQIVEITFLPSGGDVNAAVFRVVAKDEKPYFLKLRRGTFDETALTIPAFLYAQGIKQIIPPIMTQSRQLWAHLDDFNVILYPFVQGHNGFEVALTERQWVDLGAAFRAIHTTSVLPELVKSVPHETYSPRFREMVKRVQERVRQGGVADPIAAQWAQILADRSEEVSYIVQRAEHHASFLQAQPPELVLCHSDIHAGNVLIDATGSIYIIDWDNPIMAPKERDLMFIGGGVGTAWYSPQDEAHFYKGYGQTQINPVALAYYRFERIVQDIAEYGERLLILETRDSDRARWVQGFNRWFQPNDVVAMAYKAEKMLPPELQSPQV